MTPAETAAILRQFNEWLRDFDDKIAQPDSFEIGEAVDAAVELIDRLEAAEEEIAAMKQQEPVAWMGRGPRDGRIEFSVHKPSPSVMQDFNVIPLYALPGAQPAQSVPEGWKLVPIEPTQEMRNAWDSSPICEDDDAEFRRAYSEMLAAAPEAKPCP